MSKIELCLKKIDLLNEWVGRTVAYAVLPLTFITFFEVVMRYAFNRPTIWAWDVNVQLFGFIIIMGAGYTLLHGGHVIVDFAVSRFSLRQRALIDLITAWLLFFACAILIWKSGMVAWSSFMMKEAHTSVWGPPIYPLKMVIPIGAFLLMLQAVAKFVRDLIIVIAPKEIQKKLNFCEH